MGLLLFGACLTVKSKLISSLLKLYVNSCLIELVSSIQRKKFPSGGGAGQGGRRGGREIQFYISTWTENTVYSPSRPEKNGKQIKKDGRNAKMNTKYKKQETIGTAPN